MIADGIIIVHTREYGAYLVTSEGSYALVERDELTDVVDWVNESYIEDSKGRDEIKILKKDGTLIKSIKVL